MGKITDYVDMKMTILDHSERISLAVTKIGILELFIGLDWLRNHNLSIDWTEAKISFDDVLTHVDTQPVSTKLSLMNLMR